MTNCNKYKILLHSNMKTVFNLPYIHVKINNERTRKNRAKQSNSDFVYCWLARGMMNCMFCIIHYLNYFLMCDFKIFEQNNMHRCTCGTRVHKLVIIYMPLKFKYKFNYYFKQFI